MFHCFLLYSFSLCSFSLCSLPLCSFSLCSFPKFEVSLCPSPILEKLFFVDTPGVLSGEKQRIGRAYDFSNVIEWFAQRADRILLLFDAHKLGTELATV